jgi:hypothetical protein
MEYACFLITLSMSFLPVSVFTFTLAVPFLAPMIVALMTQLPLVKNCSSPLLVVTGQVFTSYDRFFLPQVVVSRTHAFPSLLHILSLSETGQTEGYPPTTPLADSRSSFPL